MFVFPQVEDHFISLSGFIKYIGQHINYYSGPYH